MCNPGCKTWSVEPNPEAKQERIQPGVPFWIEYGDPCDECVKREFELLYNRCGYGLCTKPRVGPNGGCENPVHQAAYNTPDDYMPPTASEQHPRAKGRSWMPKVKKAEKVEEPDETRWAGYEASIDKALNRPFDSKGQPIKETKEEREARVDAACRQMAYNIVHAWDDDAVAI